jgi:two-component system sensor histidine kinase YesM
VLIGIFNEKVILANWRNPEMSNKRSSAKFPIFSKLIVMFLLAIVPLYGISLLINQAASSNLRSEISRSYASQAEYYLGALEVEVERIHNLQRDYVNDMGLQRLSVEWSIMSSYERTEAIIGLGRRLHIIKNTSPYIKNVSAHIPLIEQMVSTEDIFARLPWDEFQALRKAESRGKHLICVEGRLFLSFSYPDAYVNDEVMPNFMLSIELEMKQLASVLDRLVGHQQGGAALFGPDWTITSRNAEDVYTKLSTVMAGSQKFRSNVSGTESLDVDHRTYFVVFRNSEILQARLIIYLPEDAVLGALKVYSLWFWVLSLVSAVIIVVFAYLIYRQIHQPLLKLLRAFRRAEDGDLTTLIEERTRDEFHHLYEQFNSMVRRLGISLQEAVEQKTKAQRSELKQLQMQINPHFLYNSFFLLHGLATLNETKTVIELSNKLGQYFRFLTRNGTDEVQLQLEVEHAKAYVDIQMIRFAYRIDVQFGELPRRYAELAVPRLILQPIIENAYRHGLEVKPGGGSLSVIFTPLNSNGLMITVEDNGKGLEPERLERLQYLLQHAEEAPEFTGMINVHRRIWLKYGPDSGLVVSSGKDNGLKVDIFIAI